MKDFRLKENILMRTSNEIGAVIIIGRVSKFSKNHTLPFRFTRYEIQSVINIKHKIIMKAFLVIDTEDNREKIEVTNTQINSLTPIIKKIKLIIQIIKCHRPFWELTSG